jgi:ATP-dependent helicase/nuclease subunit B
VSHPGRYDAQMEGGTTRIGKEALFGQLAQAGGASRVTVVTPNQRLARSLLREYGDRQAARGFAHWDTPDVLPFGAFVERLWDEALHSEKGASVPGLLNETQELMVWAECIRQSPLHQALMSVPFAASQCRDAWKVVHAWNLRKKLEGASDHEDHRTFLEWAVRYEKATAKQRCTDEARLADVVRPMLAKAGLTRPETLVAFGFDAVTPQQRAFLDAAVRAGTLLVEARATPRESRALRVAFPSVRDEVAACARWARARLERGASRIGIVVPDLARSRNAVARALADALVPGHALRGASRGALPFEISLAPPLARVPVANHALQLLALFGMEVEFEPLSRTLRSPFIAAAERERSARARLDVELRKRASAVTTLEGLRAVMKAMPPRTPLLDDILVRLVKHRHEAALGRRMPSAWAKAFSEALRILGFPGERALDSAEHQALAKWYELLAELATLDRVAAPMGFREAHARLADMAESTLFQPKGTGAPIETLGILESAGLEFDHLWVMGLTDEAWPLSEKASPLVPIRLQREAGVPQADPATSLEIDRRITQGWLAAAGEVVMSHALAESDRDLIMSPLIAGVAEAAAADLDAPERESLAAAIHREATLEEIEDAQGPPVAAPLQPHGTRLFRDQAACPFRGFAHHRLGSEPREGPSPGVDARERGILIHEALSIVWQALADRAHLLALDATTRDALLAKAADAAIAKVRERRPDALAGRFGEIERERLVSHLDQWLAYECQRDDFAVVANERKARLAFGGIEVDARLDRMDRLADGSHAVIDYKTGEAKVNQWLDERPDEPQLPMYVVGAKERVEAVAFARVKVGEFGFVGIGARDGMLPKVEPIEKQRSNRGRYANWQALVKQWQASLEAIGSGYARGDAAVDPKDGVMTCRLCDQQTLCRVSARLPSAEASDEA